MRISHFCKAVIFSLSCLLATSAFAANEPHKGSLKLGTTIVVNGKQLSAGDYEVRWEGAGPNVEVSIVQEHKVLATVQAQVVNLSEKATIDRTDLRTAADGSKTLSEIQFSGKKFALSVPAGSSDVQAKTTSGSK